MTVRIDTFDVSIHRRNNVWFCTHNGTDGIIFDAFHTYDVPAVLTTEANKDVDISRLLTNWTLQWPTGIHVPADGAKAIEDFASKLAGKKIYATGSAPMTFVSESAIADAIIAVITIPPV
jgi:hypothetical protein